jgi:hypothetical protein
MRVSGTFLGSFPIVRDMRPFFLFALILSSSSVTRAQNLAVVGAKVYASPTVAPVDNATIVIRAGKIVAVGKHVSVPAG